MLHGILWSVAKVNYVIPCFKSDEKSKGSLFIIHLTLILSWSLIIPTQGKSILSPLLCKALAILDSFLYLYV